MLRTNIAWTLPLLLGCARAEPPAHNVRASGADSAALAPAPSARVVDAVPTERPIDAAARDGAAAANAAGADDLPPLAADEELATLAVPGFLDAVVSVPGGATAARPVAVALHGNFDRPEWQCAVWRGVVRNSGFVLCPRGVARRDVPKSMERFEYRSGKAVEQEIDAGLAALAERFTGYVDASAVIVIGFSLGAIYASPLVQKAPQRFPRVALIEGGQGSWTPSSARAFAAAGGQRLFIGCGQSACLTQASGRAQRLEKAGLPTRSGGAAKAGHTYDGEVAAAFAAAWPWFVEGDERWR